MYCILTKLCPFESLLIYLQSILDNMSGPLHKFFTNGRIFFKLDSNVYPNWAMCRTHLTLVPALSRTLVGYESHSAIVLVCYDDHLVIVLTTNIRFLCDYDKRKQISFFIQDAPWLYAAGRASLERPAYSSSSQVRLLRKFIWNGEIVSDFFKQSNDYFIVIKIRECK